MRTIVSVATPNTAVGAEEQVLSCDEHNQASVLQTVKANIGRLVKTKGGVITVRDDGKIRYEVEIRRPA